MARLRIARVAVIDPRKLTRYCLDSDSRLGRHKARVFKAAFGFDLSNHVGLIEAIRDGILVHEARQVGTTAHG